MGFRWVLAFALALVLFSNQGVGQDRADQADEIEHWIDELDSIQPANRETAVESLVKAGLPAFERVVSTFFRSDSSTEARVRCAEIIRTWTKELDDKGLTQLVIHFKETDVNDDPRFRQMAERLEKSIQRKLNPTIDDKIMEALNKCGASISELGFDSGQFQIRLRNWHGTQEDFEKLKQLGGSLSVDAETRLTKEMLEVLTETEVVSLKLQRVDIPDAWTPLFAKLTSLKSLDLPLVTCNKSLIEAIGTLSSLQGLTLPATVEDDWLEHIGQLRDLRSLSFVNAHQVTGEGLEHLQQIKALAQIDLFTTRVRSENLRHLVTHRKLQNVSVPQTSMDDLGMKYIGQLESLRLLRLDNTQVTHKGLLHLQESTTLEELQLSEFRFCNSQAMRTIAELPNLKKVYLWKSPLLPAAAGALTKSTSLESIRLDNTFVPEDAMGQLITPEGNAVWQIESSREITAELAEQVAELQEAGIGVEISGNRFQGNRLYIRFEAFTGRPSVLETIKGIAWDTVVVSIPIDDEVLTHLLNADSIQTLIVPDDTNRDFMVRLAEKHKTVELFSQSAFRHSLH